VCAVDGCKSEFGVIGGLRAHIKNPNAVKKHALLLFVYLHHYLVFKTDLVLISVRPRNLESLYQQRTNDTLRRKKRTFRVPNRTAVRSLRAIDLGLNMKRLNMECRRHRTLRKWIQIQAGMRVASMDVIKAMAPSRVWIHTKRLRTDRNIMITYCLSIFPIILYLKLT
jgi:hypothetical protein